MKFAAVLLLTIVCQVFGDSTTESSIAAEIGQQVKALQDSFENWSQRTRDGLEKAVNRGKDVTKEVKEQAKANYEKVHEQMKERLAEWKEKAATAKDLGSEKLEKLRSEVQSARQEIEQQMRSIGGKLKDALQERRVQVTEWWNKFKSELGKQVEAVRSRSKREVTEDIEDQVKALETEFQNWSDKTKKELDQVVAKETDQAKEVKDQVKENYEQLRTQLRNKIDELKSQAQTAKANGEEAVKQFRENFRNFREHAAENMQNVADDLKKGIQETKQKATQWWSNMQKQLKESVEKVRNNFRSWRENLIEQLKKIKESVKPKPKSLTIASEDSEETKETKSELVQEAKAKIQQVRDLLNQTIEKVRAGRNWITALYLKNLKAFFEINVEPMVKVLERTPENTRGLFDKIIGKIDEITAKLQQTNEESY